MDKQSLEIFLEKLRRKESMTLKELNSLGYSDDFLIHTPFVTIYQNPAARGEPSHAICGIHDSDFVRVNDDGIDFLEERAMWKEPTRLSRISIRVSIVAIIVSVLSLLLAFLSYISEHH